MMPPPRRGAVRGDTIGFAIITFLVVAGAIYTLRLFAVPERADLTRAPAAASSAPKPSGPTDPAATVPLEVPRRPYSHDMAQDRQLVPGVWVRPRNNEGKGGVWPGIRLRFAAETSLLTLERLDPNDPPLAPAAYRCDFVEHEGIRYLKLTTPDAPQADPVYVAYRVEKNALQLEGARPSQQVQGKLILADPVGTNLLGTWHRDEADGKGSP